MGAIKAGNADWVDLGLGRRPGTAGPAGYTPGQHHPDPFAGDAAKFTITSANADQYADKLSPGHLALLKAYPRPTRCRSTRRTAAPRTRSGFTTLANATTAELTAGGNGIVGAAEGIPFPIPQNGLEAIWNHLPRAYRGVAVHRATARQVAPTAAGSYIAGPDFEDDVPSSHYAAEGATIASRSTTTSSTSSRRSPARPRSPARSSSSTRPWTR